MDRATNMFDGQRKPSPGDYTICKCGHLMVFGDDLRVCELTVAQMLQIGGDTRVLLLQKARGVVTSMKEKPSEIDFETATRWEKKA
jgi:hypothetical protein